MKPALLFAVFLTTFLASSPAWAQSVVVTNNADAGAGSLRNAISSAAPGSTITFAFGLSGQTIRLISGQLTINKNLTIDGSGLANLVIITGDADDDLTPSDGDSRVFEITSLATVTLDSLFIRRGAAENGTGGMIGGHGGGILNFGTLTVKRTTFRANSAGKGGSPTAAGGNGGGIHNEGSLTVESCFFDINQAGPGASPGGTGGLGGAIYNSGTLTVLKTTMKSNRAGDGGLGGSDTGGSGGAIYNDSGATMNIHDSALNENRAGDAGESGNGGNGGGLYNVGTMTVLRCTLNVNKAGVGGLGNGVGIGGSGGGIYNNGTLLVRNSTLTANEAGNGLGNEGGNGGNGGGIFNRAFQDLLSSTITANKGGAGTGTGKGGSGGGIYQILETATLNMTNVIVAGNTVGLGTSGAANGTGPDIRRELGTFNRAGVNLVGNNSAVTAIFPTPALPGQPNSNGDLVGTQSLPLNPLLGPLDENGGPTQTRLPLPGSPVIDPPGGSTSSAFLIDQRGLPRVLDGDSVSGAIVDIGAVEYDKEIDISPGVVKFEKEPVSVLEEAGNASIPVFRVGGSRGRISVRVDSTPGTATSADFDAVNNLILYFEHGETVKFVPVTIILDPQIVEENQVFDLTMSNLVGLATLGGPNPVSVRIIDAIDGEKPLLTVDAPLNNQLILDSSGPDVHVTGTATDNRGIEEVGVSLNGGPYMPAPLIHTSNWKSCTFDLPLTVPPGVHKIKIKVTDTRGLSAPIVNRTFTYRVVRQLDMAVNDPNGGVVTGGFEPNSQRFVGFTYTVTAKPKLGYVFDGWTVNDLTGTGLTVAKTELPKLSFIMQDGLTLTANFILNPFVPELVGAFNGLVLPDNSSAASVETVGHLSASVTSRGAASGKLQIDKSSFFYRATFDNQGVARFGAARDRTLTLKRRNKPELVLALTLDMSGASDQITGTVTRNLDGTTLAVSEITADRAHYSRLSKVDPALAGITSQRYNLILPAMAQTPPQDLNLYPQGTGVGSLIVKTDGSASFVVILADNTRFTAPAKLNKDNTCAVFAPLYLRGGCVAAIIEVDPTQAETDATGTDLLWFRPVQTNSKWYPAGWPDGINLDVFGAQHVVTSGVSVIPNLGAEDTVNGNADLSFMGGLFDATRVKLVSISASDKVTRAPTTDNTFTAVVIRSTGLAKGNVLHSNNQRTSWQAQIFMKAGPHQGAWGFFLSPTLISVNGVGESGAVTLFAR